MFTSPALSETGLESGASSTSDRQPHYPAPRHRICQVALSRIFVAMETQLLDCWNDRKADSVRHEAEEDAVPGMKRKRTLSQA
ncbi:hypothetical protein RRG08_052108 [Elysia crispata]|uniref:Uncharacterized protein n=1 Tax=Elysia crispata TaxID=231223 RepID=A0AAE1DSS3_9GAST|nr:hypothetical protein RRG08_052108 [Elysia crispata]